MAVWLAVEVRRHGSAASQAGLDGDWVGDQPEVRRPMRLRRVGSRRMGAKGISNLTKLISNCNMTISFFDRLEEIRFLSSHEIIFKRIIKAHLENLLHMQKVY